MNGGPAVSTWATPGSHHTTPMQFGLQHAEDGLTGYQV